VEGDKVSKYEMLAMNIIKNVGGKENINSLTHCVTRLRFQLKDEAKANDDLIKNLDGIVTLIKSAGQYQVVIGNHVPEVYDEINSQIGVSEQISDDSSKPSGIGATLIDFISGVMLPIFPVLTASGMLKGVLAIISFFGWLNNESGLYLLMSSVSDAIFLFFPVMLGYTSAKKLKFDPFVGAVIGAGLIYPTLQGADLNILGISVNVSYTNTVLPIILSTILASFVYKWLMKVVPDVIKSFVVPMVTIGLITPLGFMLIGPAANTISDWLVAIIMGIYSFSPIIAGLMIGGLWQLLVVFGVHMGLVAVGILQVTGGNPTPIFALMFPVSFAQTAVVFAIWMKTKDKKLKSLALPAWISGIFGVTEPAIYGITLPRVKYFIISCIFGALSSAYLGYTGVLQYQLAGMGIFAVPGFLDISISVGMTLLYLSISLLIALVPTFFVTYFLYKDEVESVEEEAIIISEKSEKTSIFSPIKGEVLPLSQASDEAFASGALGKGVVIIPEEGKVYAPIDGTVTMIFPSLHAVGLTSVSGIELLIHIGMNTVELNGEGFSVYIEKGQKVTKGDLLLEFDMEVIQKNGYSLETPVVITNSQDFKEVVEKTSSITDEDGILIAVL
jgi:PTS system beta-glucosides-specific IIC component